LAQRIGPGLSIFFPGPRKQNIVRSGRVRVVVMLFCTQNFLLFFTVVFIAYWAIPWPRPRVWLLLAASFYFYASWSRWLALIVCVTALIDYALARGMEATVVPLHRRLLLLGSLGMNVGLLVYFKYANFFLRSLEDALSAAGTSASLPVLKVLLPIGISFYTFEAINYTVDVYRRRLRAERNLAHFMLFILFFPHLVAGPIVRARDFLPQVRRRKRWDWPRLHLGGQYILLGIFKKMALADHMARFADPVFADPAGYSSGTLWLAVVAFAIQLYCDFSGYSDLAVGTAHLLGYHLVQNFNLPYLAVNVADFWRRWHISLSTWIREYLFIPLGGSRGGPWKTGRNLLVTMSLCGLWHGASWTYIAFGVVQGAYLIVHSHFRLWCERRQRLNDLLQTAAGTAGRVGLTFFTFLVSLVIFRSESLHAAAVMLQRMTLPSAGLKGPMAAVCVWQAGLVLLVGHLLAWRGTWRDLLARLPGPIRGLGYAGILIVALLLAPVTTKTFIYFQF